MVPLLLNRLNDERTLALTNKHPRALAERGNHLAADSQHRRLVGGTVADDQRPAPFRKPIEDGLQSSPERGRIRCDSCSVA